MPAGQESSGGRRSNCEADVFSWRTADRLPAAPTERTESIVESKDLPLLRGGLATAELGRLVPQSPPAAKHTNMCFRPRLAKARVLLRSVMYRVLAHRGANIHSISSKLLRVIIKSTRRGARLDATALKSQCFLLTGALQARHRTD